MVNWIPHENILMVQRRIFYQVESFRGESFSIRMILLDILILPVKMILPARIYVSRNLSFTYWQLYLHDRMILPILRRIGYHPKMVLDHSREGWGPSFGKLGYHPWNGGQPQLVFR